MAILRKQLLLNYIVEAIYASGWNVSYLSDLNEHPFRLRFYNETESFKVRIYIWNLTHGGGRARPADEYRIQITGLTDSRFHNEQGEKTLILGWWGEVQVFAGFDFRRHRGQLGASPSIQIREEALRHAVVNGFAAGSRGNNEIAIAFRPDFFIQYVKELENLHDLGTLPNGIELIEAVVSNEIQLNDARITIIPQERQTVIRAVKQKLRASDFKNRVLTAYGNRCAVSGIQLRLVDAAHIIPVEEVNSTDETCNGIALSALHHRAYDRGLITFDEEYRVIVHDRKISELRAIGFDGGLDTFREGLRPILHLPPAIDDRPKIAYITEANRLRGWR